MWRHHRIRGLFVVFLLSLPVLFDAGEALAATFSYSVGAIIPDGDLSGIQNSQSLGDLSGGITDVNVTLNVSSGFNGDFYAVLMHNGLRAVLLNRVGRNATESVGYPDFGFGPDNSQNPFTFDDQAARDVHSYRTLSYTLNSSGQLTGQWQPDGRAISPLSPGTAFPTASRSGMLGLFNGGDANGLWTLYVADVSPGGEGTLVSWGLQITTVPEPSAAALLCCGLLFLLHRRAHRAKARRPGVGVCV